MEYDATVRRRDNNEDDESSEVLRFLSLRRIVLCSGHPRGLSAPSRKKVQTVGTHFIMTYTNPHQIRVRVHYKPEYKSSSIFTAFHTPYDIAVFGIYIHIGVV